MREYLRSPIIITSATSTSKQYGIRLRSGLSLLSRPASSLMSALRQQDVLDNFYGLIQRVHAEVDRFLHHRVLYVDVIGLSDHHHRDAQVKCPRDFHGSAQRATLLAHEV